ncbi:hypothetical protein CONCODRAFT_14040 [Conidiobolus coronatus NRRL 28638]|uniref:Integrase zinc-binding domain-containing protein n=1 Tax=Conidiobolus coronatus (strain ATCC 28846 / CBS 209.66 / NRRL 28638) TaxID=796925 RepID=A0A137NPP9_CONC2|nr:hypothetical protein CONCODRAFT_14040 [Conidiobolus coronatus NRRL 28638]|eukprot:KXN64725.1 hypothetical protein CONCODRAFT_14040 [Conidiobolus coronatus NRRL 28638]
MTNIIAQNLIKDIETLKTSKYKFINELLMQNEIDFETFHENPTSSHPGTGITLELIKRQFTWPKITRSIQK